MVVAKVKKRGWNWIWFVRDATVPLYPELKLSPPLPFFPNAILPLKRKWKRLFPVRWREERKGEGERKRKDRKGMKMRESSMKKKEKKKKTKRKRRDYHRRTITSINQISPLFVSNLPCRSFEFSRNKYPCESNVSIELQVKFRITRFPESTLTFATHNSFATLLYHPSPALLLCHANCTLVRIYIYIYAAHGQKWETRERWWSLSRLFK